MDDRGSTLGRGRNIFLFAAASILALRPTQPPIRHGVVSLGVRRPGREADQ
jgi:hypothetical protein